MTATRPVPARLSYGSHASPDDGMCLMEAVAIKEGAK